MGQYDDIKAALSSDFEYDPDSVLTHDEQLDAHRYPLKKVLEQQKYAGQHDPYYSDLPASENDANTAQAIQTAADAYPPITFEQAKERLNGQSPALNVKEAKELITGKLQTSKEDSSLKLQETKKEIALKLAKQKFQKPELPLPDVDLPSSTPTEAEMLLPTHLLGVQKEPLVELANKAAVENKVPPAIFKKLIEQESSFDPKAKSDKGAMGLGQFMPDTATKDMGLTLDEDGRPGSVWNPESNLDASAKYLRQGFDRYIKQGFSETEAWKIAAGAYNAGMGNISKAIKLVGDNIKDWSQIAAVLPEVTGRHADETIDYVNGLLEAIIPSQSDFTSAGTPELDTRDPGKDRARAEAIQERERRFRELDKKIVKREDFATPGKVASKMIDSAVELKVVPEMLDAEIIKETEETVSAELEKTDSIPEIKDTSLTKQEQANLGLKAEYQRDALIHPEKVGRPLTPDIQEEEVKDTTEQVKEEVKEESKEDPTLDPPKTNGFIYGAQIDAQGPSTGAPKDVTSEWYQTPTTQLARILGNVEASPDLAQILRPPDYMSPKSGLIGTDGRVSEYENGSWSVTLPNGVTLPGLDEVTARSFSAYQTADARARAKGAPDSALGNYFNMFMQSWAIPSEMGASAFTGPITLIEKVADFNRLKRSQVLLNDPATDISDEEIAQYTAIQKAEELSDIQQKFITAPKYKVIRKLHNEALRNRAQLKAIHEEAEAYRDKFPVNDADYQGAMAAAEVIAKNEGTSAAMWHAVSNDLGTYMEQGIASIGFMVALTAGGLPVQLAVLATLAKGRSQQAIDEFITREGREPTSAELSRLKWASAAGLVAEKVSAGILVKTIGRIPGIGGQLAWVKKVKSAVDKNVKTYSSSVVHRGVVAPIGGLASEASQGAATDIAEQYAQTGKVDIEKVKWAAFHEAVATPGAAGGMMATSLSYRTAKGGVKFIMDPRGRRRNKAKIKEAIAELEAQLASTDPVIFGDTEASKETQDQLKIVEDQINEHKSEGRSSVVLERAIEEQQRLIAILEAPASGDASAEIIRDAEIHLNKLKTILENKDFSTKSETRDAIFKGDPQDNTEISEKELNKTLKDIDLTKHESVREKLTRLAKRTFSPESKKTVLAWLDKNIDRTLNAAEKLGDIFGSLEETLDPKKMSLEELEAQRKNVKTKADKLYLNAAIALNKLQARLSAEADSNLDKDLIEVDVEALGGISSRWKGLDTYRQEILDVYKKYGKPTLREQQLRDREIAVIQQKMETHANNLTKKLKAFKAAQKLAETNPLKEGYVYTVEGKRDPSAPEGQRVMNYTVSKTMSKADDVATSRAGGNYIWAINRGRGSKRLIRALSLESNYGKAAVATIKRYEASSIKQQKEDQQIKIEEDTELASLFKEVRDEIGEPAVAPITQEDIADIKLKGEEGKGAQTTPTPTNVAYSEKYSDKDKYSDAKLAEMLKTNNEVIAELKRSLEVFKKSNAEGIEKSIKDTESMITRHEKENQDVQAEINFRQMEETKPPKGTQIPLFEEGEIPEGTTPISDETTTPTPGVVRDTGPDERQGTLPGFEETVKDKVYAVIDGIIQFFEGAPKAKQYAIDNPDTSVYTLRVNKGDDIPHVDYDANEHFGNPWSANFFKGTQFNTKGDVQAAVDNYEAWLDDETTEIEPERRKWILDQIDGTLFDTRDLLYFKKAEVSHAKVLAKRIAARKSDKKVPSAFQNFIDQVKDTYESVITTENIKNLKTNLENILGLVGKKFLDLVEIDSTVEGLNTLSDTDFRTEDGKISIKKLKKALGPDGLGLSKLAALTLATRYKTFEEDYRAIAHNDIDKNGNPVQNYAIRQPLSILLRKDKNGVGKLPDQILFGMMIGSLQWVDENSNNNPFRNDRDRESLLFVGGEGNLSKEDREQIENFGFSFQNVTGTLGRNIAKMLGMSRKKVEELDSTVSKEGSEIYFDNFRIALGLAAIEIAHGNVDGTQKTIEGKDGLPTEPNALLQVKKHIWSFEEDKVDGRNFNNAPTHYPKGHKNAGKLIPDHKKEGYRHITINKDSKNKPKKEDKAALKEIFKIIDQDIEGDAHHPLESPPSLSTFVKGTIAGMIPAKVRKTLEELQNVEWTAAESMGIFGKLAKHGQTKLLYALADVKAYDKETYHENEQKSLESSNSDKKLAIDEILDSHNVGRLEKFYFKYELQNHHRIMMQGRLNPQQSKVTRFLVQSWGPKKYNQKNLWKFQLAIAHLFEFKVDKHQFAPSGAQFNKITTDPQVLEAVAALTNLENGIDEKKNAAKLADLLIKLKESYGVEHGTSLVNALTALSRYMTNGVPNTEFESDVVFEIDGITNGFAMNVLQFPLFGTNLEKILNQIGVYFGKDTMHDPKGNDVYEELIGHVKVGAVPDTVLGYHLNRGKTFRSYGKTYGSKSNSEEDFIRDYTAKDAALMQIYPDFRNDNLRSLVKYPFLIFMYGGGIKTISEGISKDITAEMYKELGRHARIYADLKKSHVGHEKSGISGKVSKETQKQLDQLEADYGITIDTYRDYASKQITPFLNQLNTLGAFEKSNTRDQLAQAMQDGTWIKFQLNDKMLTSNIADTLAPRFDYALNEMLGETKKARDAVVSAGEILHAVFKTHYDRAYKKALIVPADKERGTPEYTRKSLTRQEIIDLINDETNNLMKVYPQYAGPLSSILKGGVVEGFVDLGKTEMRDQTSVPEFVEFVSDEQGNKKLSTSKPGQLEFVAPGVSALIRQIINMDSVLLTETLAVDPKLLMLHDAFMGSPEQLSKVMKVYGDLYLKLGMQHSVLEKTVRQLNKVIEITEANDKENGTNLMGAVDKWLKENAHTNKRLAKEDIKDLSDMRKIINAQLTIVLEAREELRARRDKGSKNNWEAHQMYMAAEGVIEKVVSVVQDALNTVANSVTKRLLGQSSPDLPPFTGGYVLFTDAEGNEVKTNRDQTSAINNMESWWGKHKKDPVTGMRPTIDEENSIFVLQGRGGTGKTTIVDKAINKLGIPTGNVRFALPTHKAKQVIMGAAGSYTESQFDTIAALLGLKPGNVRDETTNQWERKFIRDKDSYDEKMKELAGVELIVVDESSMVNEAQTQALLNISKEMNIRLLFMGDNVQLPPIEEDKNVRSGTLDIARVFDTVMGIFQKTPVPMAEHDGKTGNFPKGSKIHYSILSERMRQDKGNPILGVTDILANVAEWIHEQHESYKENIQDAGGLDISFSLPSKTQKGVSYMPGTLGKGPDNKTVESFAKEYREAKEKDDELRDLHGENTLDAMNEINNEKNIKFIHINKSTNWRTQALRARIRKAIFGDADPGIKAKPFLVGERLTLDDTITQLDGNNVVSAKGLHNGDEVTVVEEIQDGIFANFEEGGTSFTKVPIRVLRVKTDPKLDPKTGEIGPVFHNLVLETPVTGKENSRVSATRTRINEQFKEEYERTGNKRHIVTDSNFTGTSSAYIINSHKAQGSTYDTVYVDYENIMRGPGFDYLTRVKALYVATSRPRTKLVLVGGPGKKFGSGKEQDVNIELREDLEDPSNIRKMGEEYLEQQDEENNGKTINEKLDNIGLEGLDSLSGLPRSGERTVIEGTVDKAGVLQLFDTFKNYSEKYYSSKEDMDGHTSILNNILNKLAEGMDSMANVGLSLEEIDGITQGQYESARNRMRISVSRQAPISRNGQSPQEVYVHEMLHAMTSAALNDRPLIAARIANLYDQTEASLNRTYGKGLGYKVFLPKDIAPSVHDIEMAKKQYNYLFNNPKKERNKLHEFLAYAVTNKQMIDFLRTEEIPKRTGLLGKLLDVVMSVVDAIRTAFGQKTYRSKDGSAHMEMVAVMEHLVAVQSKHQTLYQSLRNKAYTALDSVDEAIMEYADDQTRRFNTQVKNKKQFIASVIKGTPIIALSNHASALWVRNQITKGLNKTLRGIANEIGAGALSTDLIEQLLHAKVNVSKARQEAERFTIKWFDGDKKKGEAGIWKSVDPTDKHSMSVRMKEALTDVVLRTDLSSLRMAGISTADIVTLIGARGEDNRKTEKNNLIRRLKTNQPTGLRPALKYAQELGYHIATGKTKLKNGHMNAYTIARQYLDKPTPENVALLDAYATLFALDSVDKTSSTMVRQLSEGEFKVDAKENGLVDLLDSHLVFKQESIKDLFKENPTQSVKGYIVERVDNLTATKTGTAADKERMAKEGYTESYPLSKIDQSQSHDTLYISRNMPEVADISGVMSTTNQRNMGTTLTEMLMRDPKYQYQKGPKKGQVNFIKVKGAVRKFIASEAKDTNPKSGTFLLEDEDMQQLRPIRDETGRITDYRVMMNNASKKALLKPDLEIQNVFAHMRSSLVDRRATLDNDIATVELLVHEQMDLYDTHKDQFVDLLDPEGPYIDRFRKLPRPVREYIKQFALNGQFMVRDDIVDKVFGYKQLDVTQLKVFQSDDGKGKLPRVKYVAGMVHYLVRQIVGYGKDRIVIAMPQVVIGNMMSNIAQLSMRKIPIEYILYKIYEGIREYGRYRDDTEERVRLMHKIKAKNLDPDTSQEAQLVLRLNARIEGNKLHAMSAAGLNSLIVEDVNDAMIDGYFNRMRRVLKLDKFRKYTDKVPDKVGTVASTLFMTKSSKPYQLARQTVQMTDFLGRYVMMEHAQHVKGQSFKEAMHEALNAFVLFDEALVPALEAIDAVGATSFISYYLRNARASRQLAQTSPTSVALSAIAQHSTGLSTLGNINSSWIGGKFSPNTLQFDDLFDEANNVTLVDLVSEAVRDIIN